MSNCVCKCAELRVDLEEVLKLLRGCEVFVLGNMLAQGQLHVCKKLVKKMLADLEKNYE